MNQANPTTINMDGSASSSNKQESSEKAESYDSIGPIKGSKPTFRVIFIFNFCVFLRFPIAFYARFRQ